MPLELRKTLTSSILKAMWRMPRILIRSRRTLNAMGTTLLTSNSLNCRQSKWKSRPRTLNRQKMTIITNRSLIRWQSDHTNRVSSKTIQGWAITIPLTSRVEVSLIRALKGVAGTEVAVGATAAYNFYLIMTMTDYYSGFSYIC
jgi:hypothetical protein